MSPTWNPRDTLTKCLIHYLISKHLLKRLGQCLTSAKCWHQQNSGVLVLKGIFSDKYVPDLKRTPKKPTQITVKLIIWIFRPNLPKKGISSLKQFNELYHWILHIRISLGTEFQFKWTILILGLNLPKKGTSDQKQKNWTSPLNSAYSNYTKFSKFQNKLTILTFWTKFTQKAYSHSIIENVNIITDFCILELV